MFIFRKKKKSCCYPHKLHFLKPLILFLTLAFIDLSGLDSLIYQSICLLIRRDPTFCPSFYDLPFWDAAIFSSVFLLVLSLHFQDKQKK